MDKRIAVIIVLMLLLLTGMDCFAQVADTRVRSLQGEWKLTHIQNGDESIDFTVPPYNEMMEMVWKFEDNNLFVLGINRQTGISNAETGTFTIVGNTLLVTYQGRTDTASYTLQGNTLVIFSEDVIFTLRKQ